LTILEKVQYRLTRLFPELRNLCYHGRLQRLGLRSVEECRNRPDLLEVFKLKAGLTSISLQTFDRIVDSKTREHTSKISKNRSKLDIRKYFFSGRVVSRWNKSTLMKRVLTDSKEYWKEEGKPRWTSSSTNCLPKSLWSHLLLLKTGVATPGKIPGKLHS